MHWEPANKLQAQTRGRSRLSALAQVAKSAEADLAQLKPQFETLKESSQESRAVSADNLFQTPEHIAKLMVQKFDHHSMVRTLEPSAGLGRLYVAIRWRCTDCELVMVEKDFAVFQELKAKIYAGDKAKTINWDFLNTTEAMLGGKFDAIVMNPPFRMGADIAHVRKALELLAPGSRCVAIVGAGPRQLAKLAPLATEWEYLPHDTFVEEGTKVRTMLLVFDKPKGT